MTNGRVRIQMYNVGFGDCFLVTIAGKVRSHRILFDCGRHAGSRPPAKGERTFEEVVAGLIEDLKAESPNGTPWLDVIVLTHRHRDHIHGFRYKNLWKQVDVKEVWMPWVEDPQNPTAKALVANQEKAALRTLFMLRALKASGTVDNLDEAIDIIHNSTANPEAMETLRSGFANPVKLRYLPRQAREPDVLNADELRDVLPDDVIVHVLGPSRDPKVIRRLDPPDDKVYEKIIPADAAFKLDMDDGELPDRAGTEALPWPFDETWKLEGNGTFDPDDVLAAKVMAESSSESPLAATYRVDNALNGTSLVLLVQIGDYKLLFPGDAQWGTWELMLTNHDTKALLTGVNVYKVGHHGSHNATPREFVDDCLTNPMTHALISVDETNYDGGWRQIPLTTLVTAMQQKQISVQQSNPTRNAVVEGIVLGTPTGAPIEVILP